MNWITSIADWCRFSNLLVGLSQFINSSRATGPTSTTKFCWIRRDDLHWRWYFWERLGDLIPNSDVNIASKATHKEWIHILAKICHSYRNPLWGGTEILIKTMHHIWECFNMPLIDEYLFISSRRLLKCFCFSKWPKCEITPFWAYFAVERL